MRKHGTSGWVLGLALSTLGVAWGQEAPRALMVVPSQDYWHPDYAEARAGLEARGLSIEVAATTAGTCQGHQGEVIPADLALSEVDLDRYAAVAFVGGWGAASYQYDFPGSYANAAYAGDPATQATVNAMIQELMSEQRPVGAICFGVSVLAWARVDGDSPLAGRTVSTYAGTAPDAVIDGIYQGGMPAAWHAEQNGATVVPSGSVGDPSTVSDDVIVDGNLVTAEDARAGRAFGEALADLALAPPPAPAPRVLLVIANRDFYWREYGETREELELAGVEVQVAARTAETSFPHPNTGYPDADGRVEPDLTLADVDPAQFDAIAFVGGWGSSSYQFAYDTTLYANWLYHGDDATQQQVNQLIGAFLAEDKHVAAICHGVSVLAWARVGGSSPIAGRTVSSYAGSAPAELDAQGNVVMRSTRWHIETNGATMVPAGSIGDPTTSEDDVVVDGRFVTAQDYDSARVFGQTIAQLLGN